MTRKAAVSLEVVQRHAWGRFTLRCCSLWCEGFAPLLVSSRVTIPPCVPLHHQRRDRAQGQKIDWFTRRYVMRRLSRKIVKFSKWRRSRVGRARCPNSWNCPQIFCTLKMGDACHAIEVCQATQKRATPPIGATPPLGVLRHRSHIIGAHRSPNGWRGAPASVAPIGAPRHFPRHRKNDAQGRGFS